MKDKIRSLFLSKKGESIKKAITDAISDYKMTPHLEKGVLVGFSGGADSVMLLSFLAYYSEWGTRFPLTAVHINHSIRGEESDRDAAFAEEFCHTLGVEFICRKIDVPTLSKKSKIGLEECARNCRYSEFQNIICSRNDVSTMCIAHNADDNLETVILNMMRGAGTKGLAGIPPVRDNIVRPLIYVTKRDIVSCLTEFGIEFVVDSTNLCNDYTRNHIRNELLPKLREITATPETMAARSSRNLRMDDEYISSVAEKFIKEHAIIRNLDLDSLHEAVFTRVLALFTKVSLSSVNIKEIKRLLSEDNFSYSLPEGKTFVSEYGVCHIVDKNDKNDDYLYQLHSGVNSFEDYDADVIISDEKVEKSFLNIYKFSIQLNLSSAIINGDLYLRPKLDGDTLRYGGMTHKLKKLFNDRKVPPSKRALIPIVCDASGVVCVPGFGVRDDSVDTSQRKDLYLTLCIGKCDDFKKLRFYSGNEFNK